jgi:hypothetical protein
MDKKGGDLMIPAKGIHTKVMLLMAEKGLTLDEVCAKGELSKQRVYHLKYAKLCSPLIIHKLAKAFEIPVEHFFPET